MYVDDQDGLILAAAKINQTQEPAYFEVSWAYPAPPEQVLVMHTLVVSPAAQGKGCGTRFVEFYMELARQMGCTCLRIDTNARNQTARRSTPNWASGSRHYPHLFQRPARGRPGVPGKKL